MTPGAGGRHAAEGRVEDRVETEYPGDWRVVIELFDLLPVGMFAFEGADHICTAVNRKGRELFGDRIRLGVSYRDAAAGILDDQLLALLDQVFRTGVAVDGIETRFPLTDPSDECFLSFVVLPLHGPSGTVRGVAAQCLDVTAEVRNRQADTTWADEVSQRRLATRSFALAVQHTLLPDSLPVLPGVQLAAHYWVAADETGAGGDWFDAVPLPSGELALVTGDVAGHGPSASVMMSQLRAALTALVLDGYGVADVLARLDRFVARMSGANATTVCLVILDPASGELSYACCGHPPPLRLTAAGEAGFLPSDRGVPLGTVSAPPRVGHARLDAGDLLMLFTDGLVERSDRPLADGLEALRCCATHAVRTPDAELEEICQLIVQCTTDDEHADDLSLIAVRRNTGVTPPLRREFRATTDALPELRAELGDWLARIGASDRDQQDIQIAVGEAVANVIEHAYAGAGGPVAVEMYHDVTGRVCVTVADTGTWRPPPVEPAERGRGLIMIRACMDTVEIDSSDAGTALQMDRRLRRLPVLRSGPPGAGTRRAHHRTPVTHFDASVRRSPHPRLIVQGPVDTSTVAEFREQLSDASRGGTLPLDIDLTAVTHLASAGIQALFEFVEQMASDGRPLRLTAPPSSPARYVLELTGLDHLIAPDPAE